LCVLVCASFVASAHPPGGRRPWTPLLDYPPPAGIANPGRLPGAARAPLHRIGERDTTPIGLGVSACVSVVSCQDTHRPHYLYRTVVGVPRCIVDFFPFFIFGIVISVLFWQAIRFGGACCHIESHRVLRPDARATGACGLVCRRVCAWSVRTVLPGRYQILHT
jgi:hypothetical protein